GGEGSARRGDLLVRQRLMGRGYRVRFVQDHQLQTEDTEGSRLVVVSSSASAAAVGAQLRDAAVPVLVMQPELYPAMGMTPDRQDEDFGWVAGALRLTMRQQQHPLAAGRSGTVAGSARGVRLGWGGAAGRAMGAASGEGARAGAAVLG